MLLLFPLFSSSHKYLLCWGNPFMSFMNVCLNTPEKNPKQFIPISHIAGFASEDHIIRIFPSFWSLLTSGQSGDIFMGLFCTECCSSCFGIEMLIAVGGCRLCGNYLIPVSTPPPSSPPLLFFSEYR